MEPTTKSGLNWQLAANSRIWEATSKSAFWNVIQFGKKLLSSLSSLVSSLSPLFLFLLSFLFPLPFSLPLRTFAVHVSFLFFPFLAYPLLPLSLEAHPLAPACMLYFTLECPYCTVCHRTMVSHTKGCNTIISSFASDFGIRNFSWSAVADYFTRAITCISNLGSSVLSKRCCAVSLLACTDAQFQFWKVS